MDFSEAVLEVASQYLGYFKQSGPENIMASCPFHTSDNPYGSTTFAMSLSTGLWFCHSCKEKGNLRHFLQKMGVSPLVMDKQYGVLLRNLGEHKANCRVVTIYEKIRPRVATTDEPLPESLLGLFDKCPLDLVREGFTDETLKSFEVGFDEQHMRITFPLRDLYGRLIGISGRTVTDARQRYKVYDTEFEKWNLPRRQIKMGNVLWNIERVYPEVYFGANVPIVLVEGFKACMWLYQAGIKNAVALLGSYLKEGQQWMLEHLGGVVYVMMDNDSSGQTGAPQIGATLAKSLKVKMVSFRSSAKQPTDLSPLEVVQAIDSAEEYYLWAMKRKDS